MKNHQRLRYRWVELAGYGEYKFDIVTMTMRVCPVVYTANDCQVEKKKWTAEVSFADHPGGTIVIGAYDTSSAARWEAMAYAKSLLSFDILDIETEADREWSETMRNLHAP